MNTQTIFYCVTSVVVALFLLNNEVYPSSKSKTVKEIIVTVFVHGITSTRPHLNMTNIVRFMRDDIEDTHYAKSVKRVRNDLFCFHGQPMQEQGLHRITAHSSSSNQAIAQLFERVDQYVNKYQKKHTHYYTYGWSALLSVRERKKAALNLYQDLLSLQQQYTLRGITPQFRLIGYSHGGNVVLAIGSLPDHYAKKLVIDEVITLGMPVHTEEHRWIHSSLFKHVYHVYSYADHIQQLDIFTRPGHFAGKYFTHYKNLPLPHNLTQIKIKTTRPMQGSKRNKSTFYDKNSAILRSKGRTLRDASPGHLELWFFGWAAEFYRENFILYPLPYVIFLPLFVHSTNNHHSINAHQSLIIDIRPYDEKVIIRNNHTHSKAYIAPFLPLAIIEELKKSAYIAKPDNYSREQYAQKIDLSKKIN